MTFKLGKTDVSVFVIAIELNARNKPTFMVSEYSNNFIANGPEYQLLKHCNDTPNFDFCFGLLS